MPPDRGPEDAPEDAPPGNPFSGLLSATPSWANPPNGPPNGAEHGEHHEHGADGHADVKGADAKGEHLGEREDSRDGPPVESSESIDPEGQPKYTPRSEGSMEEMHELAPKSVAEENERERRKPLVHRTSFNIIVGAVITANGLEIGLEEDWGPSYPTIFMGTSVIFTLLFLGELVLRLKTDRWQYFYSKDLNMAAHHGNLAKIQHAVNMLEWANIADFLLVAMAIVDVFIIRPVIESRVTECDEGMECQERSSDLRSLSILRLIRLLRLFRLLRTFRELQLIVSGLVASFRTMFWVGLLLFLVIYACAIYLTSKFGQKSMEEITADNSWDFNYGSYDEMRKWYGSVPRSCYTLFMIVTLEGWEGATRPIIEKTPLLAVGVLLFIMLCSFGLMNIVIGVIVENTFELAKSSEEEVRKLHRKTAQKVSSSLRKAFMDMDANKDGLISLAEFKAATEGSRQNHKLKQIMKDLDVPPAEFQEIFSIFDQDGSGYVSVDELLEGYLRMKTQTRDKDIVGTYLRVIGLQTNMRILREDMTALGREQQEILAHLDSSAKPLSGFTSGGGATDVQDLRKEVGELRKLTYGLLLVLQGDEAAARDVARTLRGGDALPQDWESQGAKAVAEFLLQTRLPQDPQRSARAFDTPMHSELSRENDPTYSM